MKKEVFLILSLLLVSEDPFRGGMEVRLSGPQEAAAAVSLDVKSIHPLPEWDGQEDLRPSTRGPEEESQGRLKISFPVALLTTLLFFLMWKLLQGQE